MRVELFIHVGWWHFVIIGLGQASVLFIDSKFVITIAYIFPPPHYHGHWSNVVSAFLFVCMCSCIMYILYYANCYINGIVLLQLMFLLSSLF